MHARQFCIQICPLRTDFFVGLNCHKICHKVIEILESFCYNERRQRHRAILPIIEFNREMRTWGH